jgi:hypothetical protein
VAGEVKQLLLIALLAALLPASAAATAAKFNPDPVFPAGPISETTSHRIPELGRVASDLAGRHATVNCWSTEDWARFQAWNGAHHNPRAVDASGITWPLTRDIELSPFLCEILQQTLAKSAYQPLFEAFAVTVFAHESAHASGIHAEGLAECRAIKTEPRAAALFGIPTAEARRSQHIYRGTVYPNERPPYTTPICRAGLPGTLVPDELGSPAALRPVQRPITAAVHSLANWNDLEGANAVGPLSPCSFITDRKLEVARYGTELHGPAGSSAFLSAAQLHTESSFAKAFARSHSQPSCDLALLRTNIRETHQEASVASARVPAAITRLSPEIHAFRQIWTEHGERWNRDSISVFDQKTRVIPNLFFVAREGALPLSVEVSAVKAVLRAMR